MEEAVPTTSRRAWLTVWTARTRCCLVLCVRFLLSGHGALLMPGGAWMLVSFDVSGGGGLDLDMVYF